MVEKNVHTSSALGLTDLSTIAVLVLASAATAWPGHNWDEWKQIAEWTRPDTQTEQAGKRELVGLLATADGRIDQIKAWEQRRARYAEVIRRILGNPTPPANPQSRPAHRPRMPASQPDQPTPRVELLAEEVLADHTRRHLRIRSRRDDWIPAYLLLPKNCPGTPLPTMICLHQTVPQGKQEPCGIKGDPTMAFALELVRRGFVCIAPDVIGFGERIPPGTEPYHNSIAFYREYPQWSFMGRMIEDVSCVVDYLRTLDIVDRLQIGTIGHSHGAYGSQFAAAFEPRISLVIASCGFTTFRADPRPQRWSHLTALIPQLGAYLPEVQDIPFDWQHICAMIAPRPMFVWYATRDSIFPNTDNLGALFTDVRSVYGLYGAADELEAVPFDGEHRFPDAGRQQAYKWLEERFFPVGNLRHLPDNTADWKRHRNLIRRVIRRTIGNDPAAPIPPKPTTLRSVTTARYELRLLEYTVGPDDPVRAFLCLPRDPAGPAPAVLVLHQTVPEGKLEPVDLGKDKSLAFASELAARGYITLAPDSIAAGERVGAYEPFDTRGHYLKYSGISAMGKMLWDAVRAVDVLIALPGVDAERIAVVGHSLGAEQALMLAAFDARVKAVVASCGYATFAAEKNRLRWARDEWFSYMPRLRPVFQRGDLPHWDWDEILRLVAPRALLQHTTQSDDIFPDSRSAFEAGEAARAIWKLYGREDAFTNLLKPGGHGISEETKQEMYQWLDRQMKK